jgi:hypothetical protein
MTINGKTYRQTLHVERTTTAGDAGGFGGVENNDDGSHQKTRSRTR